MPARPLLTTTRGPPVTFRRSGTPGVPALGFLTTICSPLVSFRALWHLGRASPGIADHISRPAGHFRALWHAGAASPAVSDRPRRPAGHFRALWHERDASPPVSDRPRRPDGHFRPLWHFWCASPGIADHLQPPAGHFPALWHTPRASPPVLHHKKRLATSWLGTHAGAAQRTHCPIGRFQPRASKEVPAPARILRGGTRGPTYGGLRGGHLRGSPAARRSLPGALAPPRVPALGFRATRGPPPVTTGRSGTPGLPTRRLLTTPLPSSFQISSNMVGF